MAAGKYLAMILLLTPFTASAQDGPCRADVRHLRLPEHAIIDEVVGLNQPPLVFLFSQDGVDVYSATDFKAMQAFQISGMSSANVVTAILVYQDENVRQQKIEYVRQSFPYANVRSISNLKFAAFRFEFLPVWVENVLTRKWVISGMAYFTPASCVTPELRQSAPDHLEATMLFGKNSIAGYTPLQPLPEGWPHNPPLAIPPNSVLSKTLDAMKELLRTYGLLMRSAA